VLVTSQKEGVVIGDPAFARLLEKLLLMPLAENLPGNLALISHPLSQNYSTLYAIAFDFEKIMVMFMFTLKP
jgi:hypothetical protein